MVRTQKERLKEKTVERQFLYEMERDFELAPATSRAVLESAKQVLLPVVGNGSVGEGQMRITAVGLGEPAGKPLEAMKKVGVVITVDGGIEDLDVMERFGPVRLRRLRLVRMAEEAVDQGGVLSQEDLAAFADGCSYDPAGRSGASKERAMGADARDGEASGPGAIAQGEDRRDVLERDDVYGDCSSGAAHGERDQTIRGELWAGGCVMGEGRTNGAGDRVCYWGE